MLRLSTLPLGVSALLSLTISTMAYANPSTNQWGQYQQPVYNQRANYAPPQGYARSQPQYPVQYQSPRYQQAAYRPPQMANYYSEEIIPQQQYHPRSAQRLLPFQQSVQYAPPVEQLMVQAPRTGTLPPERRAILDLAHQVLGVRYKYGGNSVREGLDCSSLIQLTHKPLGRKIPRTAAEQSKASRTIARQQLRPGDLIFFNTLGKGVSHVGIYLKNGNFIHAASGGGRVMVDNLSKSYWQKRIVKYGTFVG